MKKYRIKTQGLDNEVGTIILGYKGMNVMKLNIAPDQLFILEPLIDSDEYTLNPSKAPKLNQLDVIMEVFPNAEVVPPIELDEIPL